MLEEPLPINALANHNPVLAASNEIFLNCFIWGKPSQNQIQISLPKSDIFKNLKQTIRNTFPQFKDQQINLFKTLEYLYDNDKRLLSVDTEKVNIEKSGLQLEFLDSSFEGELLTEIFDFVNLEGPLIHLIFLWDVPTAIDDLPPLYSSSEVYNEFLLNTFHPTAHICNGIVFDNENLKEYVDVKRKITLKNDTLKKKFSNVAQGEPSNSRPGVRISTFSEIRIPYSTLDYNVLHTGRSE
ncbi:hypothetical protein HK099_007483 [Clydaea vesicula]|uniref:Uncharacterized protein n=1 Tax=Clydaea vesicula TaxID=447962 RepID=A0AAD5Y2Q7_9FUNG|nr:hypothetical protein HK099_007483 [Clydaea vesicula]